MATLSVQEITLAGLAPSLASATVSGDKFAPSPTTFLYFVNGTGTARTVTVDSVTPSNYETDENIVVTVPASSPGFLVGPFPAHRFAATADGLVAVTYSAVTSLTVAALKL